MKRDYCHFLRSGAFLLVALTFCLLTACSNLWKEEISDNTENQKQSGEFAYITLGSASFLQAGARDIFPSADDLDKYNLQNVSLTGIWGTETEARTLVAEKEDWSAFYNFFSPDGFAIQTGSWKFTISAEMNGIAFTGIIDDNKDNLNDSVTITNGTTKTLNFVLKAASGTPGALDITMNIANAANNYAQSVIVSLTDLSNTAVDTPDTLTISSGSINYTRELDAGEYYIQFSFKNSDSTLPVLNIFKEKVLIIAGITTTATKSITMDTVYTLNYETNDVNIDIADYDHVTNYTRKSSTITLPELSRTGYDFGGWYTNSTFTSAQVTTITTPLATNDLYAKWVAKDDTAYVVRHWMQKIGGSNTHDADNYELIDGVSTENSTGTTDQPVSISVKVTTSGDYFGFEPPTSTELTTAGATTISADGSTVVDLYYNRRIYAISYTDGLGDTIDVPNASEAQFGASYTVEFTSVGTRENYAFRGWTDGTNTYIEGDTETFTMPADDVILTAIWIPLFAIVNGTNYFTLADAQLAIKNATDDTTVVLTSAVTRADIRIDDFNANDIVDSGTISDALRSTSAKVSLSVKSGDTVSLSGDCSYLFFRCAKLVSIDLSGFNVDEATYIYGMFNQCTGLTTLDLSSFNTSNVTNMMALFEECSNLESITFGSNFDTSNATSMHAMFSGCSKLASIDVSGFNTSKADSFTNMFSNCSALTRLDLSSWSVAANPNIPNMFYKCTNLKTILVSESFATYTSSLGTSSNNMVFTDCTSLVGGNGTTYDSTKTDSTYARIDVSGTAGYFSKPIGTKAKPTEIGDIVFKDGTATPYSNTLTLTADEQDAVIAVIFYIGTECSNDGRNRVLGYGFMTSSCLWCTTGAKAYSNMTSSVGASQKEGTNNFTKLGSFLVSISLEDDTISASASTLYPAFSFAKNYKDATGSHVAGSAYETGWYLPANTELTKLFTNMETVNNTLSKCGLTTIATSDTFWSSYCGTSGTSNQFFRMEDGTNAYSDVNATGHSACAIREF